ncbi:hypothetical protein DFP73DRAFT_620911 [Morchella snyderi]|nr:hypothetical protein DFP73DRAFT_620911 [Morchella snyderi]
MGMHRDIDRVEEETLDRQEAAIAELTQKCYDLCVAVNPLLAGVGEQLPVEAPSEEEEGKWALLMEYRMCSGGFAVKKGSRLLEGVDWLANEASEGKKRYHALRADMEKPFKLWRLHMDVDHYIIRDGLLQGLWTPLQQSYRPQRSPEAHSVGSGAAGRIRRAIHRHSNIVHDLLHVRLAHWTTFGAANIVMDMNSDGWAVPDKQEKAIAELGQRYHDLCVTICPLLLAQHDKILSVEARDEEGKWQCLLVYGCSKYHDQVEELCALVADLDGKADGLDGGFGI